MFRVLLTVMLVTGCVSVYAETGWETNVGITIRAKSFGYDSDAWLDITRQDSWNDTDIHNEEQWQFVIGNTTKYKLFEYGIGYRYVNEDKKAEHRPHIFITPQFTIIDESIEVSFENKLEYRIYDGQQDGFRYRVTPKIQYTHVYNSDFHISPYLSDQISYSTVTGDWDSNKAEVGMDITYKQRYTITPYYTHENDIVTGNQDGSLFGISGFFSC